MGANQDSYAEGHKIGLVDGNAQNYAPTPDNVNMAFRQLHVRRLSFPTRANCKETRIERTSLVA
jgi:hypothetical protein